MATGEALRCRGVRTIENAVDIDTYHAFCKLVGEADEPLLLRGAPFNKLASEFALEALSSEFSDLKLPESAQTSRQGKSTASGCSMVIADQGEESVMGASPASWRPSGCSFSTLAKGIRSSALYLSTRSGKAACRRDGDAVRFEGPAQAGPEADEGVLVRALAPKVPFPLLLPSDVRFQIVFWLGAQGKNFGLHTDLFAEQFLVQHQGTKEIFLLLPRDASDVAPFPYLSSPLWYKSEKRSVANLDKYCMQTECLRTELHPGDVLYIPLWWWHEVKTISPGPSVSTTFRFHTEDADRFAKVMNAMYWLNDNAQKRASGRLAQHLRSFLACGLAAAETSTGKYDREWLWQRGSNGLARRGSYLGERLHLFVLVGMAAGVLGFLAGRSSR